MPFGGVGLELEFGGGAPETGDDLGRDLAVGITPAVFYFLAPNLACGISLDLLYADYELQTMPYTELDLGASVGFGVHTPLSDFLGFFPRVWLGGGYMRRSYDEFVIADSFVDPRTPHVADPG